MQQQTISVPALSKLIDTIAKSSATYLYMQEQTISVPALSRLIETVTKCIKHVTAISAILATEILQAKRDAVLATFKILLDNSNHELRNTPINSKPDLITKLRRYQGQI